MTGPSECPHGCVDGTITADEGTSCYCPLHGVEARLQAAQERAERAEAERDLWQKRAVAECELVVSDAYKRIELGQGTERFEHRSGDVRRAAERVHADLAAEYERRIEAAEARSEALHTILTEAVEEFERRADGSRELRKRAMTPKPQPNALAPSVDSVAGAVHQEAVLVNESAARYLRSRLQEIESLPVSEEIEEGER